MPLFAAVLVFLTVRVLVCAPSPPRVALAGETMGTTWLAVLNSPGLSRRDRMRAQEAVQEALDRVDAAMSTWDPESEVSRFNAHVSTEPFALSIGTLGVLELARQVSAASEGAFDVTVRPLVAAWGFGSGARLPGDAPSDEELGRMRERVGWQRLALDRDSGTATKAHPALEIDLSAIAKGYGVDQAAAALAALGHDDFLLEVGGEIHAEGLRPDGAPWRLAIERPEPDGRAVHGVVELSGLSMATSGDYRSFYEAGSQRLIHIIDPRDGRPASHGIASVSVVLETTAAADAWATALSVLGPEEGHALALERGIPAYWILRRPDGSYDTVATPSFPAIIDPERQP